jgi:phospholipase D3/4
VIDNALRKAAIENLVSVKLLISYWNHSRESEDYFLRSLEALSHSIKGVDIQIVSIAVAISSCYENFIKIIFLKKRFIVPASADQQKIPFARVNHNK